MRVVVVSLTPKCPAAAALYMECIPHEVRLVDGDLEYSRILTDLWQRGEAFLTLEHDVIPWPGAVKLLEECGEVWCQHWSFPGPGKLRAALSSFYVSENAIARAPQLYEKWAGTKWSNLDGKVIPAMEAAFGPSHIHHPAFAHVRGYI